MRRWIVILLLALSVCTNAQIGGAFPAVVLGSTGGSGGGEDPPPEPGEPGKRSADTYTADLFHFDEGTGTSSTGSNGATATLTNCTWGSEQYYGSGSSVVLNGTSSRVAIPGVLTTLPESFSYTFTFTPGPSFSSAGNPRLLQQRWNSNSEMDIYIDAAGKLSVKPLGAFGYIIMQGSARTWTPGIDYRISVSVDGYSIFTYIDGVKDLDGAIQQGLTLKLTGGSLQPLVIGAYNSGGSYSNFINGTIDELVVQKEYTTAGRASSDYAAVELVPEDLGDKFKPISGTTSITATSGGGVAVLEATDVKDGDSLYTSYTISNGAQENVLSLAVTGNVNVAPVAWAGNPIIGKGVGGAPSNRQAHSSCMKKFGSTWHVWATDGYGFTGDTREVYHYTSTVGPRGPFIYEGKSVAVGDVPTAGGYGNTWVADSLLNGKYLMLQDIWNPTLSIWEAVQLENDDLNGPWTYVRKLTGLQINSGMYGGASTEKVNGKWRILYHYAPVTGNLPCYGAYATTTDFSSVTIKEAPFLRIGANPYTLTDQIADFPFPVYYQGKTIMKGEYVENTDPIKSEIRSWFFNGTLEQLFTD